MFHDDVVLEKRRGSVQLRAGDYIVPLDQDNARYAVETLEPLGHDSFFRWGFFSSTLLKKPGLQPLLLDLFQQPRLLPCSHVGHCPERLGPLPGILNGSCCR